MRKIHLLFAFFSSLFLLTVLVIETDTLTSLAGSVYLSAYCFIISDLAKSRKLTFSMSLFLAFFGIGHVVKTGFVLLNREAHSVVGWRAIGTFDFSFEAMLSLFMVELSALLGGYVCIKFFVNKKNLLLDRPYKSVSRVKSQALLFGWFICSIVLIVFIDHLGFGRHGVEPPRLLPFGIGGFLVYFRNVAIPVLGLVFLQWYITAHAKPRWVGYGVYISVALTIAFYSLSRAAFIVATIPLLIMYISSRKFSLKKAVLISLIFLAFLVSMSMVDTYRSTIYYVENDSVGVIETLLTALSIKEILSVVYFIVNRIEGSRELMAVIASDIRGLFSLGMVVFWDGDAVMESVYGWVPNQVGFQFGMTYGLLGMLFISGSYIIVFFGTIFYLAALFSIEHIFLRRGYFTGSTFLTFVIFLNIWGNMTWFFFFRFFFIALFVYFIVRLIEALVLKRRSVRFSSVELILPEKI